MNANESDLHQRRIKKPVKDLRWSIFAKIVNNLRTLTICAKSSILDIWLGSEHASIHNLLIKLHYGKSYHKRLGRSVNFEDFRGGVYWREAYNKAT